MTYFVLEAGKSPSKQDPNFFVFLTFSSHAEAVVWLYLFNVDTFFGVNNKITVVGSSTVLRLNPHNNNIIIKLLKSDIYYICRAKLT